MKKRKFKTSFKFAACSFMFFLFVFSCLTLTKNDNQVNREKHFDQLFEENVSTPILRSEDYPFEPLYTGGKVKNVAEEESNVVMLSAAKVSYSAIPTDFYDNYSYYLENDLVPNMIGYPYDEEDVILLAKVIAAEAGSDYVSDRCNELVGAVVVNRLNHPLFGNTLEDVLYQPGQYATASYFDSVEPDERDLVNARRALEGEINCPIDVVWQANFPQCAWNTSLNVYEVTDGMYYCHFGIPN